MTAAAAAPSITLHYAPHTRAGRVRWLLEELGLPHQLHRVDFAGGEHKGDAHRRLHPLGRIPVLEVDGVAMFESGAMLIYLADRFAPGTLAPALDAPARMAYLQWLFFVPSHLEPPLLDAAIYDVPAERKAAARATFDDALRVLGDALADGRPHLCGDAFTAADVSVGSVLGWARG
ncbi:MAG: glutathione S-transferase, partial [Myxococcales bacterium]|nr:glutathione S-transferase [Myxococcales bacterium]